MTITYTPEEEAKISNTLFDIVLEYFIKEEPLAELKSHENYRELVCEKGIQAYSTFHPCSFDIDYRSDSYYLRALANWIVRHFRKVFPNYYDHTKPMLVSSPTIVKALIGVMKKVGFELVNDEKWLDDTLYNYISLADWKNAGYSTSCYSKNE